jgi:hypothetical protein
MNPPSQNSGAARDVDLDRLLRSAALSRRNGNGPAVAGLLRRIALAAAAVIVLATAGAWIEFNQDGDPIGASGNEFAIADSAIQDEVAQ